MTRKEFVDYLNNIKPGFGDPDSPAWAYEDTQPVKCNTFIVLNYDAESDNRWINFRQWCDTMLVGNAMCFSASKTTEIWGFTVAEDAMLFAARWA